MLELYEAMKALQSRLLDANSKVSLSEPLDCLYKAIVDGVILNVRLVLYLEEKLLIIEPEFKADLHSLMDDAKRIVQSQNNDHLQQTAFNYGRYIEKRKRISSKDTHYPEYNQLCLALLRELADCGALDGNAMLKPEYAAFFDNGRDSVSEY